MSGLTRQFARRQAMRKAEMVSINSAGKKLEFHREWERIQLNWIKSSRLIRAKKRKRVSRIEDAFAKLMTS